MRQRGQTTFESVLIVATAGAILLLGLAGLKSSAPGPWNELVAAFSDVTRDLAWQAQDYVADWKTGHPLKGATISVEDYVPSSPGGPTRLRAAADPLKDIRALGR